MTDETVGPRPGPESAHAVPRPGRRPGSAPEPHGAVGRSLALLVAVLTVFGACGDGDEPEAPQEPRPPAQGARADGARPVTVTAPGSLQNPAWSPDGTHLLLTRWRGGYNEGPADLLVVETAGGAPRTLVADGSDNVNLPGASWSAVTGLVTFSSSREPHDEIFVIPGSAGPGAERRVTLRDDRMAFEPSFSPDGEEILFESHRLDVEDRGVVTRYRLDGGGDYVALTDASLDAREPNWSPRGDRILFQRLEGGQWDIWIADPDGGEPRRLTTGSGDETDASFSPDGRWVVYSAEANDAPFGNLFLRPVGGGESIRLTRSGGYDGAPSWSPDGMRVAFESAAGDPDGSAGSTLWVIDVPAAAR